MSEWTFHNVNRRPSPGAYRDGKYHSARDLTKRIDELEEIGHRAVEAIDRLLKIYLRQREGYIEDVMDSIQEDLDIQKKIGRKNEQIEVLIHALGARRMIQLARAYPSLFAVRIQE